MVKQEIYIQLLNEGTFVLRPTKGLKVEDDKYIVLPTPDYETAEEEWEFSPDSTVICEKQEHDGELLLVAIKRVDS